MRRLATGVLLALALAGCGDGSPAPEAVRASAGQAQVQETTTTEATTVAPGRTTTTARGARTTTTTRGGAATTTTAAPAAGPRALAPATPGTYRFDTAGATTFNGSTTPMPAVTTLVVESPGTGTRQRSIRDLRDAAGTGQMVDFTLDYRPEGVYLVALSVTSGFSGLTDVRVFRLPTPVLFLATGAGPGVHKEVDISAPSPAKLVIDTLRLERLTVGGQAVDTLVMRIVVTLTPGDISGRQELTVNIDRGSRLWVKERSVTDASALGGLVTAHSEYTATIQRLTP